MLAAIQAPVIMMSQSRQPAHDRLEARHDYEVNLMAEIEIRDLHDKLDSLRFKQWHELWQMLQRQIDTLDLLQKTLCPAAPGAPAAGEKSTSESEGENQVAPRKRWVFSARTRSGRLLPRKGGHSRDRPVQAGDEVRA